MSQHPKHHMPLCHHIEPHQKPKFPILPSISTSSTKMLSGREKHSSSLPTVCPIINHRPRPSRRDRQPSHILTQSNPTNITWAQRNEVGKVHHGSSVNPTTEWAARAPRGTCEHLRSFAGFVLIQKFQQAPEYCACIFLSFSDIYLGLPHSFAQP